ncbi:MAG: adenosylmethionine--8-amino-7-oxononanoate transaminase [Planctomycetes bacterium]|nr:adenosylmethionine--8-amino-7-oxononanoate transaminase [Planctomycetota bacterium]
MYGGDMKDWSKFDQQYIWHPFTPMRRWLDSEQVVIERGEGVYLYDTRGNRYIDGVSSLWCNIHGHQHRHIDEAIRKQLDKIAHSTLLGLGSVASIDLAERLVSITPQTLTKIFYSDSGATATEIAIKMAFQYWLNKGEKGRTRFLALRNSYHGDTIGSVSVGGIRLFHQIFGPLVFDASFCDCPHPYRFEGTVEECMEHSLGQMEKLLQENEGQVAAIIMEPLVQGAAGLIMHPTGFLTGVKELAERYGVLLILDEVAVGFGRTGTMWACEQESVDPDIMCIGKGLTGGYLPVAATLTSQEVFEAFLGEPVGMTTFYHGHTFTGNALGCAAAIASLEVFEKEQTIAKLGDKISLIDKYLREMVEMDYVGNVRQRGMMAAVELVEDKGTKKGFDPAKRIGAGMCQVLRSKGIMIRPLGDVLVIMPPLAIGMDVLAEMLEVVKDCVGKELRKKL